MAESSVKNREVEYISNPCLTKTPPDHTYGLLDDPNSHIKAARYGKIITLMCDDGRITVENEKDLGWNTIATLKSDIRPAPSYSNFVYIAGVDNRAGTQAASTALNMRIKTSGEIQVYIFSDKRTVGPRFSVAYPSA